jgi:cellulose synthase/poly-beta-1,6-N-acetylglucosamine synthase-like glycosyltransferase
LELRRVSVAAAIDTRYGPVEQPPAGGTRQAPARHRRTQPEKRSRTAPLPKQDKRPVKATPSDRGQAGHLVLPVPPSDAEKFSYVRRHSWVLTLFSMLTFPPLIYGQIRLVAESPWFLLYLPFIVLGLLTFLMSLLADGFSKGFDLAEHRRIVQSWAPRRFPSVDVFLPVCGEPIEILRNTWTHVAALRTAYPGTLTPYVLDDSGNPELKAMAKKFGFGYAARPNRGWYKKSGNLKYGFEISSGEFILLLDADFAPRADMLDETLPYFYAFPDVGIVQTPQYYRVVDEQTWVERGAGATQELFYRSIQTARARGDGAICVGSCGIYRRVALAENGGVTLAEHSEDLHTGFDLYRLGWRLRYLPIVLSTGNCPDNVMDFINQQYRWCSGTISLLKRGKFWTTKLPAHARLCYLAGLTWYVNTAAITFVAPALAICLLVFTPQFLMVKNMLFIVPVLFYVGVIYPMWHKSPYRLEAWSVRVLSSWAHVFAFSDALRGQLRSWQPTGAGAKRPDGRRRLWIGLIGWSLSTGVVWAALATWRMMTMDSYNFFLPFVLGVFQLVLVGRIMIAPRMEARR